MRPLALIYGHDGFDLDVVANLRRFYESMGYTVAASRKLKPADLLVIHRPPNTPVDVQNYPSTHVYDYVGSETEGLIRGLHDIDSLSVITPSRLRVEYWEKHRRESQPINYVVSPLPVSTHLWATEPRPTTSEVAVHIGNFKPFYADESDAYASILLRVARSGHIDIWGDGWGGFATSNGPARLIDVSRLYANYPIAVGMMYPFQRDQTYSGRFWQAPLSGARLLSEPTPFEHEFPGLTVFSSVEELRDELQRTPTLGERRELKAIATEHWDQTTAQLRETLLATTPSNMSRSHLGNRVRSLSTPQLLFMDWMRTVKHGR